MKIALYGDLRKIVNIGEININLSDEIKVGDLLKSIEKLKDEIFEGDNLKKYYIILVNGVRIDLLSNLETVVKDGDIVHVFPPVSGG